MHIFTSDSFSGSLIDCDEGVLEWVKKEELNSLPLWEGDKIFHRLINEGAPFFSLKLRYECESLVFAALNGRQIEI
jgi:8-oxo-dGTP diphosphatase